MYIVCLIDVRYPSPAPPTISSRPPTPENLPKKKPRTERPFDPAKYHTRLVAFKLAYLGKNYNGFEGHANNPTPLPTIEDELWSALNKARLIFPKNGANPLDPGEPDWDSGLEYSKCGRTDKGVSAFGQVIGIRVRSSKPVKKIKKAASEVTTNGAREEGHVAAEGILVPSVNGDGKVTVEAATAPQEVQEVQEEEEKKPWDPIKDELPYCSLLNRLLPPDIRVLAWCGNLPENFSARFSCKERQYRYFFTQPAFPPTAHHLEPPPPRSSQKLKKPKMKDGWLNIEAMQEAAKYFEGLHDFRNFCKVDGGKQIENFDRRVWKAAIEEVEDSTTSLNYLDHPAFMPEGMTKGNPKVYTFSLNGSAFLWHQVRCMVAVLFLIGQGLEQPEIVRDLLDVEANPRKPIYEMAIDTPLVLWDCIFPEEGDPDRKDSLQWQYVGSAPGTGDLKWGTEGLMDSLWRTWRHRKIDEMLIGTLMNVVAHQGPPISSLTLGKLVKGSRSQKVFDGGDKARSQGEFKPFSEREKIESVDVINHKYATRKGFENAADMKVQGFRRLGGKGVVVDGKWYANAEDAPKKVEGGEK